MIEIHSDLEYGYILSVLSSRNLYMNEYAYVNMGNLYISHLVEKQDI